METTTTTTTITATTTTATADAKVQHVTKKSSDELLRKFAEADSDGSGQKKDLLRVAKRQKKMRREHHCDSSSSTAVVERRSLLPPVVTRRSVLLRQLRARDIRNRSSLLGTIHKVRAQNVQLTI